MYYVPLIDCMLSFDKITFGKIFRNFVAVEKLSFVTNCCVIYYCMLLGTTMLPAENKFQMNDDNIFTMAQEIG